MKINLLVVTTMLSTGPLLAQDAATPPPAELGSLDDLVDEAAQETLNTETDVASALAQRLRDAPGIVTVLTRDDIAGSGARDLLDMLHIVAGFSFGVDVQGSVGPIFRGIWGQEGKVLVLWDDFEINELLFLTPPIENHFPLEAIERVEIIRGPGSALYGGLSELAVIRIVSRGAAVQGVEGTVQYGQQTTDFGRALGTVVYGQKFMVGGDELRLSLNLYGGEVLRSDRVYDDKYGNTVKLNWNNANQSPTWLNVKLDYKGFTAAVLFDFLRQRQLDQFDEALEEAAGNQFYSVHALVGYEQPINEMMSMSARLDYRRSTAWHTGDYVLTPDFGNEDGYAKFVDRFRGRVSTRVSLLPTLTVDAGVEGLLDYGSIAYEPEGAWHNGETTVTILNGGVYAQASWLNEILNVTAGARGELHSVAGASFVPRLVVSRSFGAFYGKLLASGAFKPPGIENLALSPGILPENTYVAEAEVGYDITKTIAVSAAGFVIAIQRPIVYVYDEVTDTEQYFNFERTGSVGGEVELRIAERWGSAHVTYSFATSQGLNLVDLYDTNDPAILRGAPAHKVAGSMRLFVSDQFAVAPSVVFMSERYGWLGDEDFAVESSPPVFLLNLSAVYRDFVVEGLDVSLAVFNILDTDYSYIQPYDGGHAPLPAASREILGKLTYRFGI